MMDGIFKGEGYYDELHVADDLMKISNPKDTKQCHARTHVIGNCACVMSLLHQQQDMMMNRTR